MNINFLLNENIVSPLTGLPKVEVLLPITLSVNIDDIAKITIRELNLTKYDTQIVHRI